MIKDVNSLAYILFEKLGKKRSTRVLEDISTQVSVEILIKKLGKNAVHLLHTCTSQNIR